MVSRSLRSCVVAAAVVAAFPVGVTQATEVSGADVIPRAALADATMLSMQELALSGTGIGTAITPALLAGARIVGGLGLGTTSDTANNPLVVRLMFGGKEVTVSIISINGNQQ